jgi:hypothetical protein
MENSGNQLDAIIWKPGRRLVRAGYGEGVI